VRADTARAPLTAMGGARYKGLPGGLYPDGRNEPTGVHLALGIAQAAAIGPLDVNGNPSGDGRYVLLSIGMSNTAQEFCAADAAAARCDAWTFAGQAEADPEVNHTTLAIVNGARAGQTAGAWTSASSAEYDRIRDVRLRAAGVGERQVQVVWLKVANAQPTVALPDPQADAYRLLRDMGAIARALRLRYPNLRQLFVSSGTYAGYAATPLNPEPFAYESGFAAKWLVQAQIDQERTGAIDSHAGNLLAPGVAPWIAWGPYLWANGPQARIDGLAWLPTDFEDDGTHPSQSGERKVGRQLLEFFKTSLVTRCWFLAGARCGG
jgi:hypothetical protein